jgi:hypothetical protein
MLLKGIKLMTYDLNNGRPSTGTPSTTFASTNRLAYCQPKSRTGMMI